MTTSNDNEDNRADDEEDEEYKLFISRLEQQTHQTGNDLIIQQLLHMDGSGGESTVVTTAAHVSRRGGGGGSARGGEQQAQIDTQQQVINDKRKQIEIDSLIGSFSPTAAMNSDTAVDENENEAKLFRKIIHHQQRSSCAQNEDDDESSSALNNELKKAQSCLPPVYLSNDPTSTTPTTPTTTTTTQPNTPTTSTPVAVLACKVYLSERNMHKTIKCDPMTETANRILERIIRLTNSYFSDERRVSEWVLKSAGTTEYLYGDIEMIKFDAVRRCLNRGSRIIRLNLVSIDSVMRDETEDEEDEQAGDSLKRTRVLMDSEAMIDYDIVSPEHSHILFNNNSDEKQLLSIKSLWELNEPFRVKIQSLYYFHVTIKELLNAKDMGTFGLYVTTQLYHGAIPLTEIKFSRLIPFAKNAVWDEMIMFPDFYFSELPREAKICFTCYVRPLDKKDPMLTSGSKGSIGNKDIPVGYINTRLFSHRGCLVTGKSNFRMWPNVASNEMSVCLEDTTAETAPMIFVLFEPNSVSGQERFVRPLATEKPTAFFDSRLLVWENHMNYTYKECSGAALDKELERIILHIDPLSNLTNEERFLIWKNRERLITNPRALPKFFEAVPWQHPSAVYISHQLVKKWASIEPIDSLQLLNYKYADSTLRTYAINVLNQLPDHELSDFLLQLVQTLKYELYHNSTLARFLLKRGHKSPLIIGHILYWHLRAEMHNNSIRERHGLILEEYLKHCGSHRIDLLKQTIVTDQLLNIALKVKKCKKSEQVSILREELSRMTLPLRFKLPLSSVVEASGIIVEKCKVMDSKKLPLWLVFENNDPTGSPIYVIFKAGDDLRQDLLTLQMLRIMDTMWKKNNLDLYMQPYRCVAIGDMTGMIEVVLNSDTVANITNARGGASAAFTHDPLAIWLTMHNESEEDWEKCVFNFVRSCAGYCCATYVLGIGDRHNDNIMLTKNGGLFHIGMYFIIERFILWRIVSTTPLNSSAHTNINRFWSLPWKLQDQVRY